MNLTTEVRNISTQDLAALGMQDIAYVKPALHQGEPAFAVHAADGTLVAMTATRIAAELLVRNSELEPVSVH
ncbi:MAG: hypothetical protein K0S81_3871 [Rhodospirillales bacterium]|jgi:hypothetical protein|nr:hypothetical protein [Rhodospirillales bacterium]